MTTSLIPFIHKYSPRAFSAEHGGILPEYYYYSYNGFGKPTLTYNQWFVRELLFLNKTQHKETLRDAYIMNALTSKANLPYTAKLVALRMEATINP